MKLSAVQLVPLLLILLFALNVCSAWSEENWTDECLRQIFDPTAHIINLKNALMGQVTNYLYNLVFGFPKYIAQKIKKLYVQNDEDVAAVIKHAVKTNEESSLLKMVKSFGFWPITFHHTIDSFRSFNLLRSENDEL